MKGASKVIMGATVVMVVSLAVVLSLVLVLLAELYCNLILRRRQQRLEAASSLIDTPITTAAATPAAAISSSSPSDLPFTAPPGVLRAPRSFLFPATKETSKHVARSHQSLHHVLELYSPRDDSSSSKAASPQQIGQLRTPPPPVSYLSSPQEIRDISAVQVSSPSPSSALHKEATNNDKKEQQHFIYISNPIYDNSSRISCNGGGDTPFETPDTSPSRFEESSSSGSDDEVAQGVVSSNNNSESLLLLAHTNNSITITPPLTPMKKLPAEASPVSLLSLGTLGSDSVSNVNGMSSSSSGTPCTSPSW